MNEQRQERHNAVKRGTAAWEARNICRLLYPWRTQVVVVPKRKGGK